MNLDLENLVSLQQIDLTLDELKSRENEIRSSIEAEKSEVVKAEEKLKGANGVQEESLKLMRDLEGETSDIDGKMSKYRTQLNEVKTNREYTSLQMEISSLQDKKDRVEEQIIKEMEKSEKLSGDTVKIEAELGKRRQELKSKEDEMNQKIARLRSEIDNESSTRANAVSKLRKILTDKYDKTRASRGGLAIAPLKGGSCQGCFINLPPQLVIEVRKGEEIVDCSSCGRILYFEENA